MSVLTVLGERLNGEFIYKWNPDGTWVNNSKVIIILCMVEYTYVICHEWISADFNEKLQRLTGLTKQKQNLSKNQLVGNHCLKATLKKIARYLASWLANIRKCVWLYATLYEKIKGTLKDYLFQMQYFYLKQNNQLSFDFFIPQRMHNSVFCICLIGFRNIQSFIILILKITFVMTTCI